MICPVDMGFRVRALPAESSQSGVMPYEKPKAPSAVVVLWLAWSWQPAGVKQ